MNKVKVECQSGNRFPLPDLTASTNKGTLHVPGALGGSESLSE